ncbi:MAG: DUF4301 family protein [Chitinophagaceae bacterium]|nr:DUF4301 family protein [Oligoflexus sp.]
MLKGLSEQEIQKHGLNARDIGIHQRRIHSSLQKNMTSTIKILDTWRLDNQGILPQRYFKIDEKVPVDGFVAFVPAAGAASRYFQPLQTLRQALADNDGKAINEQLKNLYAQGGHAWPLPENLAKLIRSIPMSFTEQTLRDAIKSIDSPKALLPSRVNGSSYLEKKRSEHAKIKGLIAEVYVAPLGCSETFSQHLNTKIDGKNPSKSNPLLFLEQGPELSTLRFTRDGLPYRDEAGNLSLVPAGHGMLVRLFPEIKKNYPKAHSLFIRNIDNVIEDGEADLCLRDTQLFLAQHQAALGGIHRIRNALRAGKTEEAGKEADRLRSDFTKGRERSPTWIADLASAYESLWRLLFELFHCPAVLAEELRARGDELSALRKLYDRPLNALGQVPNNGKDVGGSPVRAVHENGEVSICLELPHASPEDRKHFLEDPKVATHFNPVFVAAEIPEDIEVYDLEQCPFWILAEKNIHGTPVVYHEIVLYEVLGNSYTANVLFPEIPRRLFQPHKSLLDGLKK